MPQSNNAEKLVTRGLIRVSGADAADFLQNLITNDMTKLQAGQMIYAALLTPQGRFLHDFFIHRDDSGFLLECETARRDDLLRRLKAYKLRAKVSIDDLHDTFDVYVSEEKPASPCFKDPRLNGLGYRFYLPKNMDAAAETSYRDRRIALGVAEGGEEIKPETDTAAQANLDFLNAISWDKGCYVGQEVTAMTENRGAAKKRIVTVVGDNLRPGDVLVQGNHEVGEIRSMDSRGMRGLAMMKLAALEDKVMTADGKAVSAALQPWLILEKS